MTANCPVCGRFARAYEEHGYDGSFNQIWVTTRCAQCGERTKSTI